jgi:hypothetical protein
VWLKFKYCSTYLPSPINMQKECKDRRINYSDVICHGPWAMLTAKNWHTAKDMYAVCPGHGARQSFEISMQYLCGNIYRRAWFKTFAVRDCRAHAKGCPLGHTVRPVAEMGRVRQVWFAVCFFGVVAVSYSLPCVFCAVHPWALFCSALSSQSAVSLDYVVCRCYVCRVLSPCRALDRPTHSITFYAMCPLMAKEQRTIATDFPVVR